MSDIKYAVTPIAVSIHHQGENPIYSEFSLHLSIDDECGGPFLKIEISQDEPIPNTVRLDFEELALIERESNKMLTAWNRNTKEQTK